MRTTARVIRRLLALLLTAGVLVGCGTATSGRVSPDAVRVDNCGRTETFEHPPQRVVSLNQHATEILLAIGLGDRLVGTAFPDDHTPPESVAAEYATVPVLAQKYPSVERILAARPDLVVGGYASAFSKAEGRGRASLEAKGIDTLLLSESCTQTPAGMHTLLDDIAMFGEVLGLQDGAAELAASIRQRVSAAEQRLSGVRPIDVFVYDSGEKAPLTLGGHGIGNDVLTRAGARNVFADVAEDFATVSWEQVAARAPGTIVLVDYLGGGSVRDKRAFLEGHPLASRTPAVRHDRYITLDLVQLTEGIRFPGAVEHLAHALHGV
ncbi:iron complex transport system substrate-binding protein [Halopolyspora algeriensis]|uniref:Iron complex transport system substrate-binding protein n=1 Tax=Halopolyspora algeriensis TaxID=1500506 RepID=A0A368VPZ4_9ACTN|nr:ABC transporter substrate-binding protein [Halopolyspora algeriensis]RCW43620.1 iron complex transport system substrate-binding protein [Halopolyspora algeriensis]TQM47596.1 iron complex transport system substrate-binding protein [Halopolyspora algeriensis]